MFLLGLPRWFHWPTHGGYNFVSGPLADITLATGFLSWILIFWHNHNCHVHRCWRVSWHPHPVHGHPVCKKHFPHHRELGRATGPHSAGSPASSASSSAGPAQY